MRHFVENKKIFRKNICNLPPITLHTCRIKPTSPPSRLGEPWLPGGGNTLLDPRTPSLYRTMTPPHPTSHPTFPPADPRAPTLQAGTRSPGAPSQTHTPQKPWVMCRRLLCNKSGASSGFSGETTASRVRPDGGTSRVPSSSGGVGQAGWDGADPGDNQGAWQKGAPGVGGGGWAAVASPEGHRPLAGGGGPLGAKLGDRLCWQGGVLELLRSPKC